MGLCEGTLVFDNQCGTLPADAEEVEVTRRVFRSGETDYQVNGSPVRLKDIRDLFAGTGLGAGGYGFMEQGRIDQVLAANPVERRKVFEEAAGISRFRTRRREAELKLNRVEDNLTRLHDIVEEINRQIRSLKLHAGKARNYREMTERVRELQLSFSVHRFEQIRVEQDRLTEELANIDKVRAERTASREELRGRMREVEVELEALVERVSGFRTSYAEVAGKIVTCKEKIELQTSYVEEAGNRLQGKTEEISSLRQSLGSLEEERVLVQRDQEALGRDQDRLEDELRRLDAKVGASQERAAELAQARDAAEESLKELEHREGARAQEIARLEAEEDHLEGRLAHNKETRTRVEAASDDLRVGLEERTGCQDAQASALEGRRVALTEEERRAEELEQAYGAAVEELRGREAELDRATARAELLQESLARGEGLGGGTRALLEAREEAEDLIPGFRGVLGDLLEIDLEEAAAVEAALGTAAEAVVVDTTADALAGLRWLREREVGGGLFLPLDRFGDVPAAAVSGVRARDAELESVLSALVGGLRVVPDDSLEEVLAAEDPGPLVVTRGGDVARAGRMITAASRGPGARGLVVLKAELQDLERRLPELNGARDEAAARCAAVKADRDASRGRIKELSVALVNEEGEAARLDQEIVRIVRELDRLKEEAARTVEDGATLERKRGETRAAMSEARDGMATLARDRERAEGEVASQRQLLEEFAKGRDRDVQELEVARIDAAKTAERLESLAGKDEHLGTSIEETRRRLEVDEKEVIDLERNRSETTRGVDEERASLAQLQSESETISEALGDRERAADEVRERLREAAEGLDAVEREIGELTERLSTSRGREGELKASMESLLERARDELDLDLESGELPDVAPPETEDGAEVDWKAVDAEIRDLRARIARLGNVNLAAVEELEEAERRASFIFRERDDLLDAREQLKKILKEIEAQSTQLFCDTFEAVKEHFSTTFRRLFGGGKAEISLEDEENPLESGIEIKARPPGKEFRSIALLSGGERTMTAVGLLFAIFRANPAPCAFLDEVDAALDEDNTDRFCATLEAFTQDSQFVVVTHSKRTMEKANLLYGVTMPERGVSRRVAVRLEQMDDAGQIADIAAVNKQARTEAATEAEAGAEAAESRFAASAPRSLEAAAVARRPAPKTEDDGEALETEA